MEYTYRTSGTCSREIKFEIDGEGKVRNIQFIGGCPGNTFGVATLCNGLTPAEVIAKLKGIDCRNRGTSCPDQLACALEQVD